MTWSNFPSKMRTASNKHSSGRASPCAYVVCRTSSPCQLDVVPEGATVSAVKQNANEHFRITATVHRSGADRGHRLNKQE